MPHRFAVASERKYTYVVILLDNSMIDIIIQAIHFFHGRLVRSR